MIATMSLGARINAQPPTPGVGHVYSVSRGCRGRRRTRPSADRGARRSLLWFPGCLDDVPVGISALDADVVGLVGLLDQLDAIANKSLAQG